MNTANQTSALVGGFEHVTVHVSVPIGQFVGLLNGIAAERVALNSETSTFAIRIAKVGADGFLALQSKVRP
jgi:hypothetical protein